MKEVICELIEKVLGNSVILMILILGAIAIVGMVYVDDVASSKEIVGNAISAIAGAAGGAGLTLAALKKNNSPPPHIEEKK